MAVDPPDRYPWIRSGMRVERRDTRYLLVHPDAPRWAVVNATGLEVARCCDGQHTAAEIAQTIAGPRGLDPAAVLDDVRLCLGGLARAGFLADPGPAFVVQSKRATEERGWRLHVYLTEQCNLRCLHCAVANGSHHGSQLDGRTVRRLIDEAVGAGATGVVFSGGEPLLRSDCFDLLAHAARQVKTILATNGTLFERSEAAALVELGVIVQVSLDGATPTVHDAIRGSGAFRRTWEGIERLQRLGIGERLALNVTLMRPNVGQAPEILALADARGVMSVRFVQVQPLGRAAERWAELAPSPADYAAAYRYLCSGPRPAAVSVNPGLRGLELEPPETGLWCRLGRVLVVDATGDIYPCSLLAARQFRLGHVAETSLADALSLSRLQQLVALCERRKERIEACRACTWRHFCQAGCPGSAWLARSVWHVTDGLCDVRRELFQDLIFGLRERRSSESVCG